jgi:NADH:ubiquinone oxidoreductase subunit 3 (subunit A)
MDGVKLLLSPPVAFTIFLLVGFLLLFLGSLLAGKANVKSETSGKRAQYACGENIPAAKVQPDYALFFPFALFFTIIHVTALILATLPVGNIALMGIIYMAGVAISLYALVAR